MTYQPIHVFRQFGCRRVSTLEMYSGNGTMKLYAELEELDKDETMRERILRNTKWNINPPAAGGSLEKTDTNSEKADSRNIKRKLSD